MKHYKYFTKNLLVKANKLAKKRNYNRQLGDWINDLPADTLCPITFTLLHEHAQGERVDPHVRCIVWMPVSAGTKERASAMIDCDMALFEALPVLDIPEEGLTKVEQPATDK